MDKRAKLEALAKKKREEREEAERAKKRTKQAKQIERSKPIVKKPEKSDYKVTERPSGIKRPTPIPKNRVFERVKPNSETLQKPLFGRQNEDTYDEGDGFVVDSEDEEGEEEDDFSEESEESPRPKKKGKKVKEVAKKKKKSRHSDSDEGSDNIDEEITLEDELEDLDTSVIIKSGPGRRTRSSR
ncbi:hypothetical protein K502DRAFT_115704 [Neoconidiobolus thromboides FSU 785]|nr:hypothetical protein K502DRAFT_115704 [Neoconidiobolus thromboides FSU 785]